MNDPDRSDRLATLERRVENLADRLDVAVGRLEAFAAGAVFSSMFAGPGDPECDHPEDRRVKQGAGAYIDVYCGACGERLGALGEVAA